MYMYVDMVTSHTHHGTERPEVFICLHITEHGEGKVHITYVATQWFGHARQLTETMK